MSCNMSKHIFGHGHPAKTQISLYIYAVWPESSQGTFWIAKDAKFLHVDNIDYDQTALMCKNILSLPWVHIFLAPAHIKYD